MATKLPDKQGSSPDGFVAQTALFDDPGRVLAMDVAELRVRSTELALHVNPRLAEIRRVVGLVCWAMRAKLPAGEYGKWVEDYAKMVGVTSRTLGEWRSKAEAKAGKVAPYSSPREHKTAGQTSQLEETSKASPPIRTTSREVSGKPSEGAGPWTHTRQAIEPAILGGADSASAPLAPSDHRSLEEQAETLRLRAHSHHEVISDADGLRWLNSRTEQEWRALGDPYGPDIRGAVKTIAKAFGFFERVTATATTARRASTGQRDVTPVPKKRVKT